MPKWPTLWGCCWSDNTKEEKYVYVQLVKENEPTTAVDLIRHYYEQRKEPAFKKLLAQKKVVSLYEIIVQAKQERCASEVIEYLLQSATLVFALNCEIQQRNLQSLRAYSNRDFYQKLELAQGATLADIKKAYLKKARELNLEEIDCVDVNHFRKLSKAYEILSNPNKRKAYDENYSPKQPLLENKKAGATY